MSPITHLLPSPLYHPSLTHLLLLLTFFSSLLSTIPPSPTSSPLLSLTLPPSQVNYVVQEAIVVIKDIFRKYPNRYESIIATLCENLEDLDEPEVGVTGETGDTVLRVLSVARAEGSRRIRWSSAPTWILCHIYVQ